MTLPARRRQAGNRHRARMACVAGGARPNRSVFVRLADAMAVRAAARRSRRAFERDERMRRTSCVPGLIPFCERHLLCTEPALAKHSGPGHRRVPAAKELLIDRFVTASAVSGGELRDDREAVMLLSVLRCGRLVAIEAVDATLRVPADLIFVDHGVLLRGV